MRSGVLDKHIDLQLQTKTPDLMGGYTTSYSTVATGIWAAIWPMSAKELIQVAQSEMVITHKIRIRYRKNMSNDMRIKYGDRYFDIQSIINPNEANKMLDILATEAAS